VATALLVAVFFLNTLYLQDVLGWSALETGLAFLPLVIVIAAGANAANRLVSRIGSRNLAALGLALVAGGAGLLVLAPDAGSYATGVLPGFLVRRSAWRRSRPSPPRHRRSSPATRTASSRSPRLPRWSRASRSWGSAGP